MDKTVTITIAGELFHVEEAAYARLDSYLRSVREHFATFPDADEIVSDIEGRVAEEFAAKLSARKKVITEADVNKLIKNMGTVKDFEEFEAPNGATEKEAPKRDAFTASGKWQRLYRDADDQMLGGVCAGVAKYIGIDPSIVRILFALFVLLGGSGVIIYILLWIILPEAKTASEKVEMAHGRVTLSSIQQKINETLPKEKRDGMLRKSGSLISRVVRAVFQVIKALLQIVCGVVGFLLVIGGSVAIAALTVAAIYLAFNSQALNPDFSVIHAVGPVMYWIILLTGFLAILFPVIMLIMVGSSLMFLKSFFDKTNTVALTVQWIVWSVITIGCVVAVRPGVMAALQQYRADAGPQTTVTSTLAGFHKIQAAFETEITVSKGPYAVTMTGPQRLMKSSELQLDPDLGLTLMRTNPEESHHCLLFCDASRVRIAVSMPALDGVLALDAAQARISGFSGGTMDIAAYGASRITASLAPKTLTVEGTNASRITLSGSADTMTVTLNNAARLDATDLTASSATLDLSHASRADVRVTGTINGDVTNAARLTYHGEPAALNVRTSQAGRTENADGASPDDWHDASDDR